MANEDMQRIVWVLVVMVGTVP